MFALSWWQSPALASFTVIVAVMSAVVATAAAVAQQTLPTTRRPTVEGPESSPPGSERSRAAASGLRLLQIRHRISDRRAAPIPAAQVAAWCDSLSRRLRSGDSLRAALERDRPPGRDLQERTVPLRRSLEHGASVADAVATVASAANASRAGRDPHLDLLCSVLAATADFGGGAAAPIDRVGATLRLRSADGQERAAQSAQARLSAHVLTVVPLAVLALLVITDADVRAIIRGSTGIGVIGIGLSLNLIGWYWMHRTISVEAS